MNDEKGWKWIGPGCWINETIERRVILNEDYKRTYRAFVDIRGAWRNVMLNKAGNPIRFRTVEAAMRYAETH